MNKNQALLSIVNFIENSNVDPSSQLYRNALDALEYIEQCRLIDNRDTIALIWCIDDVLEIRPDLTEEQAGKVLTRVEDIHDASIGVSWDTLQCVADDMFPEVDDE